MASRMRSFCPAKCSASVPFQLIGGREVDEAVAGVVGRAFEAALGLCLGEGGAARDLVDRPIHGSFYLAPIGEAEQAGAENGEGGLETRQRYCLTLNKAARGAT